MFLLALYGVALLLANVFRGLSAWQLVLRGMGDGKGGGGGGAGGEGGEEAFLPSLTLGALLALLLHGACPGSAGSSS